MIRQPREPTFLILTALALPPHRRRRAEAAATRLAILPRLDGAFAS